MRQFSVNCHVIYTIIVVIMLQLDKTVKDGLEAALGKYGNTSSVEKDQIDYLQSEVCTCMLNFFQLGHTIIDISADNFMIARQNFLI